MMRPLTLIASVLALSAGSVLAQTATHAPTKPAADAAARYDRSLEQSERAKTGRGADGSSSGASSGTETPTTRNGTARDNRETAGPDSKTEKSK